MRARDVGRTGPFALRCSPAMVVDGERCGARVPVQRVVRASETEAAGPQDGREMLERASGEAVHDDRSRMVVGLGDVKARIGVGVARAYGPPALAGTHGPVGEQDGVLVGDVGG